VAPAAARPEGFVAALTFVVIGVDLLTGARLQMSSLAGYSPIVAGRFAGVGNVAFAVFATGALLCAAALCVRRTPRQSVAIVAAVGVVAVVIDGSPLWGSDFGGVLALVPSFALLGVLVSGRRPTWAAAERDRRRGGGRRGDVRAARLRPAGRRPDPSRPLRRSAAPRRRGRGRPAQGGGHFRLLTRSVLTLVVPLAVVFLTMVLLRPMGGLRRAFDAVPELRAGLISVLVMGVAGFAFNDSGVAVPALALTIAVPIALAASLAHRQDATAHPPRTPA
jgi:hypothetical protein